MARRVEIGLQIKLQSALSVGSGAGRARWLDTAIVRDARGDPYLPASSLKGALRQAGREILRIMANPVQPDWVQHCLDQAAPCRGPQFCPLCVCFGSPRREALFRLRDATLTRVFRARDQRDLQDPFRWAAVRDRVAIDRRLGRAVPSLLFSREYADAGLVFESVVEGVGAFRDAIVDDPPIPPEATFLIACAALVDRLGAGVGHGAGAVRIDVAALRIDGNPYPASLHSLLSRDTFEIALGEMWNTGSGSA